MASFRQCSSVACAFAALASGDARAFVFADGATAQCIAAGQPVTEVNGSPGSKVVQLGHTATTERVGSGYRIVWNAKKLGELPPAVHDLIFFHECAHAQVPTNDELRANCVGLKAMRAAGRGGFAIESKLASFYGPDNPYWVKTLKCADTEAPPAPASN